MLARTDYRTFEYRLPEWDVVSSDVRRIPDVVNTRRICPCGLDETVKCVNTRRICSDVSRRLKVTRRLDGVYKARKASPLNVLEDSIITPAYSSNPIFPFPPDYQPSTAIMHFNLALVAAIAAFAPSTMACVGKSNMPKATDTKSSGAYIEVKAGETYDGKFVRFDRGSGACKPGEGGK